ncbi:MAG: asparaginase domain-containing protein [Cytophagales bacterium]|nr:asparaginase domain-containing protein [Cytophagales bacterium]
MIHIITTGGTIEGIEYDSKKNSLQESKIQISKFIESANVSFDFAIEQAFSVDSRHITNEDREYLLQIIKSSNSSKILITHGTMTMVETSKFLGILGLNKTIVLVGSFLLGNKKNTDANFNLGYAISAVQFLNDGVFIAMHGKIFPWNNVLKNIETNQFEYISI